MNKNYINTKNMVLSVGKSVRFPGWRDSLGNWEGKLNNTFIVRNEILINPVRVYDHLQSIFLGSYCGF